jgi:hypothetical protein
MKYLQGPGRQHLASLLSSSSIVCMYNTWLSITSKEKLPPFFQTFVCDTHTLLPRGLKRSSFQNDPFLGKFPHRNRIAYHAPVSLLSDTLIYCCASIIFLAYESARNHKTHRAITRSAEPDHETSCMNLPRPFKRSSSAEHCFGWVLSRSFPQVKNKHQVRWRGCRKYK